MQTSGVTNSIATKKDNTFQLKTNLETERNLLVSVRKDFEREGERNLKRGSKILISESNFLLRQASKQSLFSINDKEPRRQSILNPVPNRGSNLVMLDALSSNFKLNQKEQSVPNQVEVKNFNFQEEKSKSKSSDNSKKSDESSYKKKNSSLFKNSSNDSDSGSDSSKSGDNSDSPKEDSQNSTIKSEIHEDEERDKVADLNPNNNNPNTIIVPEKKERNEKALKLWAKAKFIIKGIFNFQKISKNLQLYGTSEGQFDENNPEVYLNKLKRIQSSNEIKEIETVKDNTSTCNFGIPVFNPDGRLMTGWNLIVFCLMMYTAIIMPYRVSFIDTDSGTWTVIENTIDMIFFSDILVTLNLAFYNSDNVLVTSRKAIFITYLKSWLLVDMMASFPQGLVLNSDGSSNKTTNRSDLFRLARLTRLYRLVRLVRFLKIAKFFRKIAFIQRIQDFFSINYGISRLISFLFTTLILSHLMGCLWYIIPKIFDEQNSWVVQSGLQDEDPFRLYLFSLYWSFATIFTVGFGDIHAYNTIEYIISIFWMLFGVGFYSFTIGTLSSVLVNMDTRENILKGKLAILNEFCKQTKLPAYLKERVKKILVYNSQKNVFSWIDKQEIFNELPANLKFEIAKSMRSGFLKDILFFTAKYDSFIAMIVPFLLPLNFQEKEPIYKKGDHPSAIYFLTLGRVHFVNDDFIPFRTMVKGCYFGEIDILLKQRRAHTVISGESCDTLTLSKQIYENVIAKEYPEIDNEIKTVASLRMQKYSDAEKELNDRFSKKRRDDDSYERENEENDSFAKAIEEKNNEVNQKFNVQVEQSKRFSNFNLPNKADVVSTTYNLNSVNSNKLFDKTNLLDNDNRENSINGDINFNQFDKSKEKANSSKIDSSKISSSSKNSSSSKKNSSSKSSKNSSSFDNESDYFSESENEKIKQKIDNFKGASSVAKEQVVESKPIKKEPTLNSIKSGIFPIDDESEIKDLKVEMKKYSQQQKEIMQSLNTILEKMNLS